jgi:hypothetical protein
VLTLILIRLLIRLLNASLNRAQFKLRLKKKSQTCTNKQRSAHTFLASPPSALSSHHCSPACRSFFSSFLPCRSFICHPENHARSPGPTANHRHLGVDARRRPPPLAPQLLATQATPMKPMKAQGLRPGLFGIATPCGLSGCLITWRATSTSRSNSLVIPQELPRPRAGPRLQLSLTRPRHIFKLRTGFSLWMKILLSEPTSPLTPPSMRRRWTIISPTRES